MVSVIIPYYNKKATINRAVDSVINQTYNDWEIIIVDDFSSSPLTVQAHWKDYAIYIVRNDVNKGPGPSRQRGMEMAKGAYLAFLDADDWWAPEFIHKSLLVHLKNNRILATWCISKIFTDSDPQGHIRRYNQLNHCNLINSLLKYGHSIQTSAFLWQKKYCGNWGHLSTNQDSWFEYSSCLNLTAVHKINEVLLFRDETGDEHRKKYVNDEVQKQNTLDLYINVKQTHDSLSIVNRALLFNRILVAFVKIKLLKKDFKNEQKFRSVYPIYSSIFGSSIIALKLTHRLLQLTPFKIYH